MSIMHAFYWPSKRGRFLLSLCLFFFTQPQQYTAFHSLPKSPITHCHTEPLLVNMGPLHTSRSLQLDGSFKLRAKDEDCASGDQNDELQPPSLVAFISFSFIAFFYWYWMIFGAAASANNFPFIPDWLPMVPGWPPTDSDLAPAIEDSVHFFYLSDILNSIEHQVGENQPPALRLGLFNIAEAWIFAFLPVMQQDSKRLPGPVVFCTWLGALGLTNAFLAPYMACRELLSFFFFSQQAALKAQDQQGPGVPDRSGNNPDRQTRTITQRISSFSFAAVGSAVVGYAMLQIASVLTGDGGSAEWDSFKSLVVSDRTYLAFCVDLFLFSVFQAWLLKDSEGVAGKIPLVGLLLCLIRPRRE